MDDLGKAKSQQSRPIPKNEAFFPASRKSFTRVKPKVNGEDVISDEARVLFESVPKVSFSKPLQNATKNVQEIFELELFFQELIEELYELYRADHELFDYDPRPYLNLGY